MSCKSEMKDIREALIKQGFTVEQVKSGHWKVTNPLTGRKCQIASTPRENRGVLNAITRLKRIGYTPVRK